MQNYGAGLSEATAAHVQAAQQQQTAQQVAQQQQQQVAQQQQQQAVQQQQQQQSGAAAASAEVWVPKKVEDVHRLLVHFYHRYNRSKTVQAKDLAESFFGGGGKDGAVKMAELNAKLRARYGSDLNACFSAIAEGELIKC